ncbi:YcxB family protein [Paenibacillus dakarensis]|uniref:YcxB family protein n=1 Tax=Paenibacillus dakarensis TaxID=1527293 RepID=UPI0006D55736|nr:YcxB family protein [Paenibacillus dakarensis]
MRVSFTYRDEEFIQGVRQSFGSKKRFLLDVVLFGVFLLYGIFLLVTRTNLLAGVVIILVPVVYFSVIAWRHLVIPKLLYEQDSALREQITITFLEDEVIYQSANQEYLLTWDNYIAFKETIDYIYLFIFNRTLTVIPKRIFSNKEDQLQLIALLESKLVKKKK